MSLRRTVSLIARNIPAVSRLSYSTINGGRLEKRWYTTNTDNPRILITGGLGQLGSGLARVMRYITTVTKDSYH